MSVPSLPHSQSDHDEYLIARLAAGELDGREAESARALVAQCIACAELLSDLVAISTATAALPAPRRTRDFRVTAGEAARLRRTGWRRLVALFGQPRFTFTRPLAIGLAALGIAGLILGSLPSGFGAGSAAAPAIGNNDLLPQAAPASGSTSGTGSSLSGGAAPSAAPSAAPAAGEGVNPPYRTAASPAPVPDQAGSGAPKASGDKSSEFGPVSTPPTTTSQPAGATESQSGSSLAARDAGASGPPTLTVLSLGLLLAGLLVATLRVVARRI